MTQAPRIRTTRSPLRLRGKDRKAPATSAPRKVAAGLTAVDYVNSQPHLQRVLRLPMDGAAGREFILRRLALHVLTPGVYYADAELVEVLRCFTGCPVEVAAATIMELDALGIVITENTVTPVRA